jgi:hypothetical protein
VKTAKSKTEPNIVLTVYVPPAFRQQIEAAAAVAGQSLSTFVARTLSTVMQPAGRPPTALKRLIARSIPQTTQVGVCRLPTRSPPDGSILSDAVAGYAGPGVAGGEMLDAGRVGSIHS